MKVIFWHRYKDLTIFETQFDAPYWDTLSEQEKDECAKEMALTDISYGFKEIEE